MARGPDLNDPVAAIRGLLRDLRASRRLATSPVARILCPGVPVAQRQPVILSTIHIALYRLPVRQQEIIRRYDVTGEAAGVVQRALGLSPRQFFRDRRAALSRLTEHLLGSQTTTRALGVPVRSTTRAPGNGRTRNVRARDPSPTPPALPALAVHDAELAPRALARSLAQTASPECLRVLCELAYSLRDSASQMAAVLDLADAGLDFDKVELARQAERAASRIVSDNGLDDEHVEYFAGRLERIRARLADTRDVALVSFARATSFLRRCLNAGLQAGDARWALAETLGDLALFHFADGTFADARSASAEACRIVTEFEMWSRPRALELVSMDATLRACFSGRTGEAIAATTALLSRAHDSGWCATASHLGANLVGLNGIRGDYEEAIRWYHRLTAIPGGARPSDRSNMIREAAHAYTMLRRPEKALHILAGVGPGSGCPSVDNPGWHAYMSAALERSGQDVAALAQARQALAGYSAHEAARGTGDAHRLIAISSWKLRDMRTAMEHILEAQRLVEASGTPYGLLRTLVAKANIVRSSMLRREAIELAKLLLELGKDAQGDSPTASRSNLIAGAQ